MLILILTLVVTIKREVWWG